MDSYTACSIVEGFSGEEHTQEDHLNAWACLIKSGQCWQLQGSYGRGAQSLIDAGTISREGEINWDAINQLLDEKIEREDNDEI